MLKKILLFAFLLVVTEVFAQEKVAYINSSEIFKIMPEYIQIQDSIKKIQKTIQNEMNILEEEYRKKIELFQNEADNLVENIKMRRIQEIKDIEKRAENFCEQSQNHLQQVTEQLFSPIRKKVREAIKKVGEEYKFTYILEGEGILYANPSTTFNATSFVKQKLKLK